MNTNKQLIIFEGIASSGKTTLENSVASRYEGSCATISEAQTLMPLIENKDAEVAQDHLKHVCEQLMQMDEELILIDRLHLTHAFRTHSELSIFASTENFLLQHFSILLVLLVIDEGSIKFRIEDAQNRRGPLWKHGKEGSLDEKVQYYIKQQRQLITYAQESTLPHIQIDTTGQWWDEYADVIFSKI